jgi:hypothetical protein
MSGSSLGGSSARGSSAGSSAGESRVGRSTSHVAGERLLELSRGQAPGTAASAEERAHLERCAECSEALAGEEAIGRALRSMAWPAPSASFVALAQARFVIARRAQDVRRRLMAAVGVAALATLLLLAVGTLGIISAKQVLMAVTLELKEMVIALHVLATIMSRAPLLPFIAILGCACSFTLSSVVLAKLLRAPAVAE